MCVVRPRSTSSSKYSVVLAQELSKILFLSKNRRSEENIDIYIYIRSRRPFWKNWYMIFKKMIFWRRNRGGGNRGNCRLPPFFWCSITGGNRGWSVEWSVCHNSLKGRRECHFHAPIRALVSTLECKYVCPYGVPMQIVSIELLNNTIWFIKYVYDNLWKES